MYTLFTDSDKVFSCNIDVDGVSLNECKARILIEHPTLNLVFNGTITNSGQVSVPIKKMKNILPENATGTMKLEVIADNTLFEAWNSEFKLDTQKKVSITEVNDVVEMKSNKPTITVKLNETPKKNPHADKINKHISILESEIKKLNVENREQFDKVVETYGSITTRKKVLSENDMKVIKSRLIKKLF